MVISQFCSIIWKSIICKGLLNLGALRKNNFPKLPEDSENVFESGGLHQISKPVSIFSKDGEKLGVFVKNAWKNITSFKIRGFAKIMFLYNRVSFLEPVHSVRCCRLYFVNYEVGAHYPIGQSYYATPHTLVSRVLVLDLHLFG